MSLATMKKKTQANNYKNHSSIGGFSLNSSRRVESHSGETSIQTLFRGSAARGTGVTPLQPQSIVQSQYNNADPYDTPRPTNKNTRGYLSHKMRWLNGGYPMNVVKSAKIVDYELYINDLKNKGNGQVIEKSACMGNKTNSKDLSGLSYEIYQKTKLLENNCLPLPLKDAHYPPYYQCNNTCSECYDITLEEFKEKNTC